MSYIIGSKCVGVKDGACIDACPVDCISIGEEQMYINPDSCIDCGACQPACPVDAVFEDELEAIKQGEEEYVHKNYEYFNMKYEKN
jgi:NAD-dependent dihydropyrimidine dehydrogenase PreA subunit